MICVLCREREAVGILCAECRAWIEDYRRGLEETELERQNDEAQKHAGDWGPEA